MEQRKMELVDRIGVYIRDEISARDSYRDLAGILRARDYLAEARQVSSIADEEDVHANLLMTILQNIKEKPDEIMMSGRMIEVPLGEKEAREAVEHGSYVIFTNLDTGETKQYYNVNPSDSAEVVSAAMFIKPVLEERWGKNIKFDIVPAEKLPTEGLPGRPFPKTYGDWVNLAEDIKIRDSRPTTISRVNVALFNISETDDEESKQWLTRKAAELGIK